MAGSLADNRLAQGSQGRFQGKVALVTGAGSGIGRAVASRLLSEGARVCLFGRTLTKLEETIGTASSDQARCVEGRHENPADAERAVRECHQGFGRLDILINNAGEYLRASLEETSLEDWRRLIDCNLTGPFVMTRAAIPLLREARGAVINISSTLGLKAVAGVSAYASAKAGLIQLTRCVALEEAHAGVRVSAVCPGVVDTPIHSRGSAADRAEAARFLDAAGKLHPLGRVGAADEVASAVLFLASDESSWTTGAVVTVDGGISIA